MKKILFAIAIVAMMALSFTSCNWGTEPAVCQEETTEDTIAEEEQIDTIGETATWFDSIVSEQDTLVEDSVVE